MREQMRVLRWEAPGPAQHAHHPRPSSAYEAVAEALRERPGAWGVVREGAAGNGIATKICKGHMDCFRPAGDFEATTRMIDGRAVTYARYLGGGEW